MLEGVVSLNTHPLLEALSYRSCSSKTRPVIYDTLPIPLYQGKVGLILRHFSPSGMKMTMVLSYFAVIYLSTGI